MQSMRADRLSVGDCVEFHNRECMVVNYMIADQLVQQGQITPAVSGRNRRSYPIELIDVVAKKQLGVRNESIVLKMESRDEEHPAEIQHIRDLLDQYGFAQKKAKAEPKTRLVADLVNAAPGMCFTATGIAMMTAGPGAMRALIFSSDVRKSGNPMDGNVRVVHLNSMAETYLSPNARVDSPTAPVTKVEAENQAKLRAVLESDFTLGSLDVHGKPEKAKPKAEQSLGSALYQDQLNRAKASSRQDERAVASAEANLGQEEVPKVEPTQTKGDAAVDKVREGALKGVDDALVGLDSTRELMSNVGVDEDLRKALDKGIGGFADYKKLRKKSRRPSLSN